MEQIFLINQKELELALKSQIEQDIQSMSEIDDDINNFITGLNKNDYEQMLESFMVDTLNSDELWDTFYRINQDHLIDYMKAHQKSEE